MEAARSADAGAGAVSSGGAAGSAPAFFEEATEFGGARPGMVFKLGHLGLGYYLDSNASQQAKTLVAEVRPRLPESWRDAALREERLRVDSAKGAGLSLGHCEFGFAVEEVEEVPGQVLQPGEVIVAVEGRVLAGLSGPQMKASFVKRRVDGARLQVASLSEVRYLAERDPAVVECWDATNQRVYYFHKKTGRSSWTLEELKQEAEATSSASQATAAPVDLSTFLSHGFSAPKEPPKKKQKAKDKPVAKDESDLAREERARWKHWNDGGRGGYTEMFFDKYKSCQSNPAKPKKDKRLQGSVGPGNGMEYMARWTGSKNSFN